MLFHVKQHAQRQASSGPALIVVRLLYCLHLKIVLRALIGGTSIGQERGHCMSTHAVTRRVRERIEKAMESTAIGRHVGNRHCIWMGAGRVCDVMTWM